MAMNAGEVKGLAGMINFQEGSIVSRELVASEAGTVTLFAFDQNQGLSEHTAPFNALVHILEGTMAVRIEANEFKVETGEVILLPAHKTHALTARLPSKMLLTMIRGEDLDDKGR